MIYDHDDADGSRSDSRDCDRAECPITHLEAPPRDELDLVVLVVPALRPVRDAAALEVGVREVVAEREREGPRRPPDARLGLEVVDAEEGPTRARGIGDERTRDRPATALERPLGAPRPAEAQRAHQLELRVDPPPDTPAGPQGAA